ncbi:MAG: hypothetical protein LBP24_04010 [Coriobacteriales bacterium]|jgi:hypothetical protein|nr:hypothetical protein [Coriobacteriales bacterium]
MLKASEEKSRKTHETIARAFEKRVADPASYKIVYGYFVKSGIFSKKVSNYVVGYSETLKEIVIVPITFDAAEVAEAIRLKKEDIISAKFGLQGDLRIKSNVLPKDLRFIVPPFTTSVLEATFVMPIVQQEETLAFRDFIKNNF